MPRRNDKIPHTAPSHPARVANPASGPLATAQLADHRPESAMQRQLQEKLGQSARVQGTAIAGSPAIPTAAAGHGARSFGQGVVQRVPRTTAAAPAAPAAAAAAEPRSEEQTLAEAFQRSTFYYGTVGSESALKTFLKATSAKVSKQFYYPGIRAMSYLKHRGADDNPDAQMMDMYYGEHGTSLHERRNPAIGAYVHGQMSYSGEYDQGKSGRDAYRETYAHTHGKADVEGWKWPNLKWGKAGEDSALWRHPETGEALTGTMEISRIIRDGIMRYGGELVFDGKNVIHKSNFVDGTYQGDTNKEARALFPFFAQHPGASRVPFGNGTLIFHWGGREAVPTQNLFLSHWDLLLSKSIAPGGEDVAGPQTRQKAIKEIDRKSIFWQFPVGEQLQTRRAVNLTRLRASAMKAGVERKRKEQEERAREARR